MNDRDESNEAPPSPATVEVPAPTQPPSGSGDGWRMPEPKFQQSSGYLPQGYIDQVGMTGGAAAAAVAPAEEERLADPAPTAVEVEPQPDLSEQLEPPAASPTPAAVAKPRSTAGRVVMLVLGLIGMVLFIAVFLGVVYYLFIAPQNGGSGTF